MIRLKSYVAGQWAEGAGNFRPLHDPTTEVQIAEASTDGVDMGAAVAYARSQGLAGLRELTFAQRGELLAAAAKGLYDHRDELLELSTKSGGNTRGDAKFDVDGATGTLQFYAELGRKLGDKRFLTDGDMLQLARSPRFTGQHVFVPREGVAVHINAFNFPAWGMAEKAAVAWLAGVPVITKPATSTAILTHRMVEILIEKQVLPQGALSLISGGVGDLLDHLGDQDLLAFTGSSDTAVKLRSHASVLTGGTRLTVEADSLNAAVLGRDVDSDSETFDLFVKDVVRDMTQKAGQKCTAIRRLIVPEGMLTAAREALVEGLRAIRVGDPALKEVRMGPVATASQLRDVKAGLEQLEQSAKVVTGGERGELHGVDGDKGYFLAPTLLEVSDPADVGAVHDLEVFGPVATLIPYSGDPLQAAAHVARGKGCLVSSVYTDKVDVAQQAVLGMAPYCGRVNIGGAKVAEHSLGPGAVLPSMLHGGPGRAGGGEELGGIRGLLFYCQHTALQGYKPLLEKITADALPYADSWEG